MKVSSSSLNLLLEYQMIIWNIKNELDVHINDSQLLTSCAAKHVENFATFPKYISV